MVHSDPPHLLARSAPGDLQWQPFPHLVLREALPAAAYEALAASYPDATLIRRAKHVAHRHQLTAPDILAGAPVSPRWRDFVAQHVSETLFRDAVRVFGPAIRRMYPWLEAALGTALEAASVEVRNPEVGGLADVGLDCQPGLNEVAPERSTPRTPHLDAANKLLTGLLYFREPEDDAEGGDLLLYRLRSPRPRFESPAVPHPDDVEAMVRVPYAANTAVFFLNSPVSIHGVSMRDATQRPRRLVNWVCGLYRLSRSTLFGMPPSESEISGAWAALAGGNRAAVPARSS